MTAFDLAAIRQRAGESVLGKPMARALGQAVADRRALLDLVDEINESANDFAQAATSLSADNVRLGDRLAAVRELHKPETSGNGQQYCESCVEAFPWGGESIPYPCPTIAALDGP